MSGLSVWLASGLCQGCIESKAGTHSSVCHYDQSLVDGFDQGPAWAGVEGLRLWLGSEGNLYLT